MCWLVSLVPGIGYNYYCKKSVPAVDLGRARVAAASVANWGADPPPLQQARMKADGRTLGC